MLADAKSPPVFAYCMRSPQPQEALQGAVQCFNNVNGPNRRWNAVAEYAKRFTSLAIPGDVYETWRDASTIHLCRVESRNDGSPVLQQIAHRRGSSLLVNDYPVMPLAPQGEQMIFLLNLLKQVIAPPAPNVADQKYCTIRPNLSNTCTISVSSPFDCAGRTTGSHAIVAFSMTSMYS